MIPKGVLSSAETISVTRTKPHSNTPDTENATKNLNKNSECKSNQIRVFGDDPPTMSKTDVTLLNQHWTKVYGSWMVNDNSVSAAFR